ncbi:hypothetical protein CVT26_004772 [Gymnopilus dilepis]|uniref:Uncharacterized protein n=1 Tax=Gymnopilus dilepis TaxID=231916 RepID=A0A409XZC7_9AGAR|nr:hypothetical protein CVT26_004772 [Gymnopilus dilepis]
MDSVVIQVRDGPSLQDLSSTATTRTSVLAYLTSFPLAHSASLNPCVMVKVANAVPAFSHGLAGPTDLKEFMGDRLLGRRVLRMAYRRLLYRLLANYLASCLTAT